MANSAAVELLTGKSISMIMPPEHVHNHNTIIIVLRETLTATSNMVPLMFSINSGLDTLARIDLHLRFLTHTISTHHTDHGE
jgi:hypothetical protein